MPCITSLRVCGAACVAVLAACPLAHADHVSFVEGGRLSGNVLSIQDDGAIRLESPLAAEPISLQGESVERIEFERSETTPAAGNTRFELHNRDFLMGTLLSYSPEAGARIQADGIGEIELPAGTLRSMALDVQSSTLIYNGPDELANWTVTGRGANPNWQFHRQRLTATGSGQIGRMLDLPERYVIRLKFNWQGQPNFQLGFSDPLEEQQARVDRYYLQFGRAGIELKREAAEGRRWHTIGILNRTPDQFANREMEIELRVDRTKSVIHLAINGNQEGRFMDHSGSPPTAGGISLRSSASAGHQLEITSIMVESWQDPSTRQSAPVHNVAGERDALVMREGDHFGGVIESIQPSDRGLLFSMKVDFREDPMVIHGDDVSIVGFAAGQLYERDAKAQGAPDFVLKLHDRGRLTVTQSAFEDGRVRAAHPLLGDLILSRASVSSLERHHHEEEPAAKR
ncbi:MAG: hypothetical protein ACNA8L_09230 [Luteolibacter sp.]